MSKFYIKSGAILAALCLGFASSAASQPAAEATRAITAPDAQAAVKETTVSGVAPMPIKAPPINEVVKMRAAREAWRKSVLLAPKPKKGCFEAAYPDAKWTEVPCVTPPLRPYPPRSGIRPDAVGNGLDFSAEVTGDATSSEGSFDSVSGVTSEAGGGTANTYSLQLNTEFFTTTTCGGAKTPASCRGWEQYVFSNSPPSSGAVFIQYWLINYVNA